jgi:hypothetical protein
VEQVHGKRRAGQHAAHRRGVDAAQVDADRPDRVPPGRGGAGRPVRGVIGGAAFRLARLRDGLAALADETRLRILFQLRERHERCRDLPD